MIESIRTASYLASLKWKQGEVKAISTFRGSREDVVIRFDMPPAGDFDHDAGRVLEPTEHINQFGPKLRKAIGKRGVFIDAAWIDDDVHRQGLTAHPLTQLLERARLSGAQAFPVTSPERSREYQAAVSRYMAANAGFPICVRLDAAKYIDEFPELIRDIRLFMFELQCNPRTVLLDLDLGALDPHDPSGFAELLAERINALPNLHSWLNVSVTMTSFPERLSSLKPGQVGRFRRTDWEVYQALQKNKGLLRMPLYGDYAVEFPKHKRIGAVPPVAHLRYTSDESYVVSKGTTTKKPFGYESIFPVASTLVAQSEYMGEGFSSGDSYINQLAVAPRSTGNASTWRWASTDHHLTKISADLRAAKGLPALSEELVPAQDDRQLKLV